MMLRIATALFLGLWLGLTLVFSEFAWFRKPKLTNRLAPHVGASPSTARVNRTDGLLSGTSMRTIALPLVQGAGERLSAMLGLTSDLDDRLRRVHAEESPADFRMRQATWALGAVVLAALLCLAVGAGPVLSLFFVLGAPLLAFLLVEQQLLTRAQQRQRDIEHELPVVAEQLAMLLGAGYSLGAALARLADRGSGACSQDFARLHRRIQQGVGVEAALREWATIADLEAVDRLVGVLQLNRESGDLGRMISDEARSIRREAQRRQIERIERRNQQVWIPVTVATLVPGVILLAVPFIDALSAFSGS